MKDKKCFTLEMYRTWGQAGPLGEDIRRKRNREPHGYLHPASQCNLGLCVFCLDTDMVIIYLSAGITSKDSSEEDKKATLRVINEENGFLNNSVMILTYALMNGRHCFEILLSDESSL